MVGPWEKDYTPGRSLKHFLSGSLWKKFVASDNVCSAAPIQSYLSITGSVTLKSFVTFGGKIGFPKRENNPTCRVYCGLYLIEDEASKRKLRDLK